MYPIVFYDIIIPFYNKIQLQCGCRLQETGIEKVINSACDFFWSMVYSDDSMDMGEMVQYSDV